MPFTRPPGFRVPEIASKTLVILEPHHDRMAKWPHYVFEDRVQRAKLISALNVDNTKDVPSRVNDSVLATFERLREEMIALYFQGTYPGPKNSLVIAHTTSMDDKFSGRIEFETFVKGFKKIKVQIAIKENRSMLGPAKNTREITISVNHQVLNPSAFNEKFMNYMNRGYGLRHIILDLVWPAVREKHAEDVHQRQLNRRCQNPRNPRNFNVAGSARGDPPARAAPPARGDPPARAAPPARGDPPARAAPPARVAPPPRAAPPARVAPSARTTPPSRTTPPARAAPARVAPPAREGAPARLRAHVAAPVPTTMQNSRVDVPAHVGRPRYRFAALAHLVAPARVAEDTAGASVPAHVPIPSLFDAPALTALQTARVAVPSHVEIASQLAAPVEVAGAVHVEVPVRSEIVAAAVVAAEIPADVATAEVKEKQHDRINLTQEDPAVVQFTIKAENGERNNHNNFKARSNEPSGNAITRRGGSFNNSSGGFTKTGGNFNGDYASQGRGFSQQGRRHNDQSGNYNDQSRSYNHFGNVNKSRTFTSSQNYDNDRRWRDHSGVGHDNGGPRHNSNQRGSNRPPPGFGGRGRGGNRNNYRNEQEWGADNRSMS